ncbi:MAG: hypothetical protein FWC74_09995 [Candidatus Bathyarchaeota archaeon]|nr:hypothetical protein [Candidatus Termitimicrobium sp.]
MNFQTLCEQLETNGLTPPKHVEYYDAHHNYSVMDYQKAKAKTQFGNWNAQIQRSHIVTAAHLNTGYHVVTAVFSYPKTKKKTT